MRENWRVFFEHKYFYLYTIDEQKIFIINRWTVSNGHILPQLEKEKAYHLISALAQQLFGAFFFFLSARQ